MVRCTFCGYEADLGELELFRDPWRFRFYEVKMLKCPKCKGIFHYYTSRSPSTSKHRSSTCELGLGLLERLKRNWSRGRD